MLSSGRQTFPPLLQKQPRESHCLEAGAGRYRRYSKRSDVHVKDFLLCLLSVFLEEQRAARAKWYFCTSVNCVLPPPPKTQKFTCWPYVLRMIKIKFMLWENRYQKLGVWKNCSDHECFKTGVCEKNPRFKLLGKLPYSLHW